MQSIPCFYHPTTLILIDDDLDFLHSLDLALTPHYKSLAFTSPDAVQEFLQKNPQRHTQQKNNYLSIDPESLSECHVHIALSQIHQLLFSLHRFNQITIAIIDYDMPRLNGLALARLIKQNTTLKIIMLTGEADQATAINAFNEQHIDRFVLKSVDNYLQQLLTYITELQQDYFVDLSRGITDSLSSKQRLFNDPDFIDLFHKISTAHRIVEYYLVDPSGSFLMVDAAGQVTWLIVRTDEDMQSFYELAEAEPESQPEFINALNHREKIVCFPTLGYQPEPIQHWRLHDAIQLANKKIYYCVLTARQGYALDTQHVLSYVEFLQLV